MQITPNKYWAKLEHSKDLNGKNLIIDWMPLEYHLTDVAVVFEALICSGYSKVLGNILGQNDLTEIQKKRLTVLSFIHDIGKYNYSFQWNMFRSLGGEKYPLSTGHQKEACFFLAKSVEDKAAKISFDKHLRLSEMINWFDCEQPNILAGSQLEKMLIATFMHHGWQSPDNLQKIRSDTRFYARVMWNKPLKGHSSIPYLNTENAFQLLSEIINDNWGNAYEKDDSINASPEFMREYNGILNLADWIASDKNRFIYWHDEDRYISRYEYSSEQIIKYINETGLMNISQNFEFNEIFGFNRNFLQSTVYEIANAF